MKASDFKQFPMLADLSEQDLEAVAELLEEKTASAGVPLFREGSGAEGLLLINRGKVMANSTAAIPSSDRQNARRCRVKAAQTIMATPPTAGHNV